MPTRWDTVTVQRCRLQHPAGSHTKPYSQTLPRHAQSGTPFVGFRRLDCRSTAVLCLHWRPKNDLFESPFSTLTKSDQELLFAFNYNIEIMLEVLTVPPQLLISGVPIFVYDTLPRANCRRRIKTASCFACLTKTTPLQLLTLLVTYARLLT